MTHPICARCNRAIEPGQLVSIVLASGEDPAEVRIIAGEDALLAHADPEQCFTAKDEHDARYELAELEEMHGDWLDGRIERELGISLGDAELKLYDAPRFPGDGVTPSCGLDWQRGTIDGGHIEAMKRDVNTEAMKARGWVRVREVDHPEDRTGWVRRHDLLAAIAAVADEMRRAERAAGWDPNP